MSVQEPTAPALSSPSVAPVQERAPSSSKSIGDAPTIDPSLRKKATGKNKAQKKRVAEKLKPAEPAETPRPSPQEARYRYDPYRKVDPIPESEGNLPASPDELETLDVMAKMIYQGDREALEYIEALQRRTAAIMEQIDRTGSQLHSVNSTIGKMQLFMGHWSKMSDRRTHKQLSGDGNSRTKWGGGKMTMLGSHEPAEEENDAPRNPDLFPTLARDENGAFPIAEDHLSRNAGHPDFPYDYARDILGEFAPRPPNNDEEEEDFYRPETPPARQPSLPPGHEDENGLEYAEDEIEMRSDFTVPPNHAALRSDDSTFNRSGADLRIASDTGLLFPPSEEEFARISKEFKREVMDSATALTIQPPADPSRLRHPLAQSYVPSSSPGRVSQPAPHHLVFPLPVPRTPSPPRTVLGGKRKRVPTPEDEEYDAGNVAGPSTIPLRPNATVLPQTAARNDEDRSSPKKRRLITHQPPRDSQMFVEPGYVPAQPRTEPPARENFPEPSSQPAHKQVSPPSNTTSQIQKEDSELEKSQVIEMLSQDVEQGGSGDEEESISDIFRDFGASQRSLSALTADNTQAPSPDNTKSGVKTPANSQVLAEVPASIPEDVFGPIVLSVKAKKISDRLPAEVFKKGTDGDAVMSDSEHETTNVSIKSTRFSVDDKVEERARKVFRKTPIRPRTSLRVMEAEIALAAEAEAESRDMLNPLASPKKKRVIGARVRKPKPASSTEAESTFDPEDGLPSISASKPPSKLRRGRSASVQPDGPALPKTLVKRSTRDRK